VVVTVLGMVTVSGVVTVRGRLGGAPILEASDREGGRLGVVTIAGMGGREGVPNPGRSGVRVPGL
jgi:hypothetical protein